MQNEQPLMNLPNQLTVLRLALSVVLFVFLAWEWYGWGFVFFLLAAVTDWLDGYIARKYRLVTHLGRSLDPFADKVIICGTFIFLVANPEMQRICGGLRAWMVVVIVVRELLVTVLRSIIEERGGDFSAKWSGKIKMVLQCVAAATCLFYLTSENPLQNAPPGTVPIFVSTKMGLSPLSRWWCTALLIGSVWGSVLATIYSGVVYVVAAVRILKK
jgi:CDP-diacylglycerol--glycerol-3-phosphate 3-phosphatidyltransferase